jgi:hypothetical protein
MQPGSGPRPFDVTSGFLIELDARAWLDLIGLPAAGTIRSIESDVATVLAEVDKVLHVGGPNPWLAHLELQASRDPALPMRLLQYHALLLNRHTLPVETTVVLLRRQADGPELSGRFEQHGAQGNITVTFNFRAVRVWERSVHELLSGGLIRRPPPLAALADLDFTALPDIMRRLDERFTREADPGTAHDLRTATAMLLGLRYHDEEISRVVHRMSWIEESSVYQAAVRRGQAEGRSIGLLEGREEGLAQGRAAEARRMLIRFGTVRFGPPSPEIEGRLSEILAVDRLEHLADRIASATSWDDLREALGDS